MKTIGKYEICGLLGRGGMGVVYKARLPVIGQVVALKALQPRPQLAQLLGQEELVQRFQAEARILAGLSHPNLVQVWDYGQEQGRPYFTMEYLCRNLGQVLGETYRLEEPCRRLDPGLALHYARQTLEGLARLHQAGLVHRDIKPFNLLLDDQDTIRICDFGLSRLRGEVWGLPGNLKVGSPCYAAPEQEADPAHADARADLYAVGVLLLRMVTGRLEVPVGQGLRQFHPGLDQAWEGFMARALARRPQERFASAGQMLAALEELALAWQAWQEGACAGSQALFSQGPAVGAPRARPVKVLARTARQALGLDALWRPRFLAGGDLRDLGDGIVADRALGLLWQKNGSDYPLSWQEAGQYVEGLNRDAWAGRRGWRLPTVEEALTLVREPASQGDLCLEAVFSRRQDRVWSADRRSYTSAWFVSLGLGFVGWQDFTCRAFTRAVCPEG